jgi:hypothetical protein
MLRFVDAKSEHMHFAAVLREIGGDFFADERARQMGDFQSAVDGVVIGESDQVHPPFPGDLIDKQRLGKTFRTINFLQNPLGWSFGMFRMNVKVGFHFLLPVKLEVFNLMVFFPCVQLRQYLSGEY